MDISRTQDYVEKNSHLHAEILTSNMETSMKATAKGVANSMINSVEKASVFKRVLSVSKNGTGVTSILENMHERLKDINWYL